MSEEKYNYRSAKCCYTCKNYKQEDYENFGDCPVINELVDDTGICDMHEEVRDKPTEGN